MLLILFGQAAAQVGTARLFVALQLVVAFCALFFSRFCGSAIAIAINKLFCSILIFMNTFLQHFIESEVGGENGAERRPPPGIQAQRPRTRTARTTRQINGAIRLSLRRFLKKCLACPTRPTSKGLHPIFSDPYEAFPYQKLRTWKF